MRILLALTLYSCGQLVAETVPPKETVGYVQEVHIAPPPKVDVLFVLDGAAVALPHVRAGLEELLRSELSYQVGDLQLAFTTADASGCDATTPDGRCGRLIASGGQTVFSSRRDSAAHVVAALPAIFDVAIASASTPARALEASYAALATSELFREDDQPAFVFVAWRPDRSDGDVDKWLSLFTNTLGSLNRGRVVYFGETSEQTCDAKDDGRYALFANGFRAHTLRSACAEPEAWGSRLSSLLSERSCFALAHTPSEMLVSYTLTDEERVTLPNDAWELREDLGVPRVCLNDSSVTTSLRALGGVVRFDMFVEQR